MKYYLSILLLLVVGCGKSEPAQEGPSGKTTQNQQQQTDEQPSGKTTQNQQQQSAEQPSKESQQNDIRISRETTWITEPIDDDGYIDYVQALNDRAAQGATAQNNFEVVVRQVMTSDPLLEKRYWSEYFRLIGIPVPDKSVPFYRDFFDYMLQGSRDSKKMERLRNKQDRIMTQPWKASEYPAASKWVAEHKKHLDQLVEGSRRTRSYAPYLSEYYEEDGGVIPRVVGISQPSAHQQHEIARGLTIRAMGRIAAGDLDGAWNDLQAIHRIARHLGSGIMIIDSLVAIGIDSVAFNAEVHILNSPGLTDKQCKQFLADLKSLTPLLPIADSIDVGERFMGLDAVTSIARHVKGKNSFQMMRELLKTLRYIDVLTDATLVRNQVSFVAFQDDPEKQVSNHTTSPIDWNVTLQVLNGWYDKMVTASREPDWQQRQTQFEAIEQEIQQLRTEVTKSHKLLASMSTQGSRKAIGEAIGNILVVTLLPGTFSARQREDSGLARNEVIRIGFALDVYQREMGMLPKSLADLAPRYLETIPKDPHSGTDLKYVVEKNGFLVYSVGLNGIDDKGRSTDDANREQGQRPKWDDIVVRVGPFTPLEKLGAKIGKDDDGNVVAIDLKATKVTDAGLVHLKGLANLETLLLYNTQVTNAGVAELQTALPNCKVNH